MAIGPNDVKQYISDRDKEVQEVLEGYIDERLKIVLSLDHDKVVKVFLPLTLPISGGLNCPIKRHHWEAIKERYLDDDKWFTAEWKERDENDRWIEFKEFGNYLWGV